MRYNKDITIKEIENLKNNIEKSLLTMLQDFEEVTGISIESIELYKLNVPIKRNPIIHEVNLELKF